MQCVKLWQRQLTASNIFRNLVRRRIFNPAVTPGSQISTLCLNGRQTGHLPSRFIKIIAQQLAIVYLLLWRAFISTVLSFIGFKRVKKHERKSTLLLKWENHSYDITFKEFSKGLEEATLRDLKEKCKLATGVPVAAMKLTVSGANMKDETAQLSSYGVHSGSIIVLEGKPPGEDEIQETASGNPEEVGLNLRIAQTVEKLRVASVPVIEKYDTEVSEYIAAGTSDEAKRRKLFDMSAFINEQIMQALFTLDGITCAPEFTTARQKRREGVRYAQSLLDRLDKVKADLKAHIELLKA